MIVKPNSQTHNNELFHRKFEAQVAINPHSIAVAYKGVTMSYQELNNSANQLARVIVKEIENKGCERNSPICLFLHKNIQAIVAIVAVLKSGAAYVPISIDYPEARVAYFLNHTASPIVLSEKVNEERLSKSLQAVTSNISTVFVDEIDAKISKKNLDYIHAPEDLAYILYTSGTTGRPKGVMLRYDTFSSFIETFNEWLSEKTISFLSFTSITFDIFGADYGSTLSTGGKLHICDYNNVERLTQEDIESINFIQQTPSAWNVILDQIDPSIDLSKITVIVGGESGPPKLYARLDNLFKKVLQGYGPTEACIWSSGNLLEYGKEWQLGLPLPGEKIYLLDEKLELVAPGEQGEMYIGGKGLAVGYWKDPELTAKRFIANPFFSTSNDPIESERLYASGDLAKEMEDGSIKFLGRKDSQVKLRGHRIELGEIENIFNGVDAVKQTAAVIQEYKEQKYLIVYIVPNGHYNEKSILIEAKKHLPIYMTPDVIQELEEMPLNTNGKINRIALPKIDLASQSNADFIKPRTETEQQLAAIWEEVLNFKPISINDSFFRLGGNSIQALLIASKCRKQLNADIPITSFYELKTIQNIAAKLYDDELITIATTEKKINPLSFAQQGLFFIENFEQGTYAYHIPLLATLSDEVELDKLENAINVVVKNNAILRTVYYTDEDGNNIQEVKDFRIKIQPISAKEETDQAIIQSVFQTPFDLANEAPFRIHQIKGEKNYLLFVWHHIAFDGWSTNIFLEELSQVFNENIANKSSNKIDQQLSYIDYTIWQQSETQKKSIQSSQEYWDNYLKGFEPLCLHYDKPRPEKVDYTGAKYVFEFDKNLLADLTLIARKQETSINSVLLTAFVLTLNALSGQDDLVMGIPTDNRPHPQLLDMMGCFVNTLPFRAQIEKEETISKLMQRMHEQVKDLKMHQAFPFDKLVDHLQIDRDSSRHPLYQVVYGFHSFQSEEEICSSLPFDPIEFGVNESSKYDLDLAIHAQESKFTAVINYATTLFDDESIVELSKLYLQILENFRKSIDIPVSELSLISDTDKKILLDQWKTTGTNYPENLSLQHAFEQQVKLNPQNVALVVDDNEITYTALNARANQLAHLIRSQYQKRYDKKMTRDSFVGLFMKKGVDFIVGILAVIKAGGAYVAISTNYPKERVSFMLNNTAAPILITGEAQIATLIMEDWFSELKNVPELVLIDDETGYGKFPTENLNVKSKPEDLAYVVYTSGTTGNPKGILAPHRGVTSLICNTNFVEITKEDVFIHLSDPNFDAATFEIWGALLNGARLVIPSNHDVQGVDEMEHLLQKNKVTIAFITRAYFDSLLLQKEDIYRSLRYIFTGGEVLTADLMRKLVQQADRPQHVISCYGPTEATTFTTTYNCDQPFPYNVPIGKPINAREVFVVDQMGRLAPIMCPGELLIGGPGLARCYLNRPDLSIEKFIQLPELGGQVYRSGDLVRWLPNGNLDFLGRIDRQIKLRGFRIEPSEIENAMTNIDDVEQAVVVVLKEDNRKTLGAYYVSKSGAKIAEKRFRELLTVTLPDYMIPTVFQKIEEVPISVTGKRNYNALPEIKIVSNTDFRDPENEIEKQLLEIWKEVLSLDKISTNDNFFHIGGDSIVAIRVIAKAKQQGIHFGVQDVFSYPTLSKISPNVRLNVVESSAYVKFSLLEESVIQSIQETYKNVVDAFPASAVQKGMLLESSKDVGVYHDVLTYKMNSEFIQEKFEAILNEKIAQHEMLRTIFISDEHHGVLSVVLENSDPELKHYEQIGMEVLVENELNDPFTIGQDILYRFIVSNQTEDSFLLSLSIHHAIIDGWSVASLITEITEQYVYDQKVAIKNNLPSYAEFVRKELDASTDKALGEFWKEYIQSYERPLIPFVKPVYSNEIDVSLEVHRLTENQSAELIKLSQTLNVRIESIFLALYYQLLCVFENSNDLAVGVVTNNRLEIEGGDKMIGLFLNTIPFRPSNFNPTTDAHELIQFICEEHNQVLKHKRLPYPEIKANYLANGGDYTSAFNYIHFRVSENSEKGLQQNNPPIHEYEKINIPMLLTVDRNNNGFTLYLAAHKGSLSTYLFDKFWTYFKESLIQLADNNIQEQKLLSTDHLLVNDANLLTEWNKTNAASPLDQTLHQIFEKQVEATPSQVALIYEGDKLTYAELNEAANRLANLIRNKYNNQTKKDIQSDTLIPIYFERGFEMVISILAVLKSGAAYVPLGIEHPIERIKMIVEEINPALILTQKKFSENFTDILQSAKTIFSEDRNEFNDQSNNLKSVNTAIDLAYVIYTSGTTGKPKGVAISHQASASRNWHMSKEGLTKQNIYLFKTNYIFDVSVSDLFSHLFVGATIVISNSIFDPDEIAVLQKNHKINASHFVPSQYALIQTLGGLQSPVDQIYFSGESLTKEILEDIDLATTNVINYYGPTETGEATCFKPSLPNEFNVIGRPFPGAEVYVLSDSLRLLPVGIAGELYIGGPGLARGYYNNPELTKEKFIPNPFYNDQEQNAPILYKTGDMVQWLPEGNLMFIGRVDKQIKIRGNRVELAEIETVLQNILGIAKAVVADFDKNQSKYLVGYAIAEKDVTINTELVFNELRQKLPDYMIPSAIVQVDNFPLTPNGKLDKKRLPNPEIKNSTKYSPPVSELEKQLCQIWEQVLGVEKVGLHDNFYTLGGNSMDAVRLISTIRKRLNWNLPLSTLVNYNTIFTLSLHFDDKEDTIIKARTKKDKAVSSQTNRIKL